MLTAVAILCQRYRVARRQRTQAGHLDAAVLKEASRCVTRPVTTTRSTPRPANFACNDVSSNALLS